MGTQLPLPYRGTAPQFLSNVRCGQTSGWMKTPLGTEVDLGPDHIVLDGVPALRERGTSAPIFSAHVYCGHGDMQVLIFCELGVKTHIHAPKIGALGQNRRRGNAALTPKNSFLLFWDYYLCATFGENRSRNATARVRTDRQTDRLTYALTETN